MNDNTNDYFYGLYIKAFRTIHGYSLQNVVNDLQELGFSTTVATISAYECCKRICPMKTFKVFIQRYQILFDFSNTNDYETLLSEIYQSFYYRTIPFWLKKNQNKLSILKSREDNKQYFIKELILLLLKYLEPESVSYISDDFDKIKNIIAIGFNSLSNEFASIYYDILGIHSHDNTKYKIAEDYFNSAIALDNSNKYSIPHKMVRYHRLRIWITSAKPILSLIEYKELKGLMTADNNYERSQSLDILASSSFIELNQYEMAEAILDKSEKVCLQLSDNKSLIKIQNNRIWNYLLWRKYGLAIQCINELSALSQDRYFRNCALLPLALLLNNQIEEAQTEAGTLLKEHHPMNQSLDDDRLFSLLVVDITRNRPDSFKKRYLTFEKRIRNYGTKGHSILLNRLALLYLEKYPNPEIENKVLKKLLKLAEM